MNLEFEWFGTSPIQTSFCALGLGPGPTHIQQAYKIIHAQLQQAGINPTMHILDNETSNNYEQILQNKGNTKIQFVPPNVHRRNSAERAIRTFKAHLIAGLCSTDSNFPLNLWDRLLPQAVLTLNLL